MNIIKTIKYIYLIIIIISSTLIFFLNTFFDSYKNRFDRTESNILNYYTKNDNIFYIIFSLSVIIMLRSIGFKDTFNIMNFFITLISKSIIKNSLSQLFFSLLLSSTLLSIIRVIKYFFIGFEIQQLYSKPINIIFLILKKLIKLLKIDYELDFLTTQYIIDISLITKKNKKYDLFYFFSKQYTKYTYINNIITFFVSIFWIVFIEWIPPFKDLLLYIHNWNINKVNFLILICSEFINLENFISLFLLNKYLYENKILESQFLILFIYTCLIVLFYASLIPNLIYVRKYYFYLINEEDNNKEEINEEENNKEENNENVKNEEINNMV